MKLCQTLKQRKNTHPKGEREEQNERTDVQPRDSTHQCKKHNIQGKSTRATYVLNLSQVAQSKFDKEMGKNVNSVAIHSSTTES